MAHFFWNFSHFLILMLLLLNDTIKTPIKNPSNVPSPSPTKSPISNAPTSSSPTAKPTSLTSIIVTNWINPNDPSAQIKTYFPFDESNWGGLFGPICGVNPCQSQNVACGEHGSCVAVSQTEAKCKCDTDWSGESCETTCGSFCSGGNGLYPYGCNPNLNAVVKYGCLSGGGCNYLGEGSDYPHGGFCTFKEVVQEWDCLASGSIFKVNQWRGGELIWTGDMKVWPVSAELVSAHGRMEPLVVGAFQEGDRIMPWTGFN